MAIASIDYEKVESMLLTVLMQLNSLQNQVVMVSVSGTKEFVNAIDTYRNSVALEIEKQGTREF